MAGDLQDAAPSPFGWDGPVAPASVRPSARRSHP